MHTRDEDKRFRCQECGKGFPLKWKLFEHEAIHKDVKPFTCRKSDTCSYTFASSGNRTKHEQTHDQDQASIKHGDDVKDDISTEVETAPLSLPMPIKFEVN